MEEIERMIIEIKEVINKNYDSEDCGLTEECSEGNGNDVFYDGVRCGIASTLYEIGEILGMSLEDPAEQKYSWED